MTPENFCYWLQGFTELQPGLVAPTPEQWAAIAEHLQHVFHKQTPPVARPAGPFEASPARDRTPADLLRDAIRNPQLGLQRVPTLLDPFPLIGPGTTITC